MLKFCCSRDSLFDFFCCPTVVDLLPVSMLQLPEVHAIGSTARLASRVPQCRTGCSLCLTTWFSSPLCLQLVHHVTQTFDVMASQEYVAL